MTHIQLRCRRLALSLPLWLGLTLSACSIPSTNSVTAVPTDQAVPTEQAVVTSFVETVVTPNYAQLVKQTAALQDAIRLLTDKPTEAHLQSTRQAWLAARQTWETSESWAFGPAATEGFDGAMDDWPVNRKDLATALSSGRFSPETFATLSETAKGFHGIEWVIYGGRTGSPPSAEQLSANELVYLGLAAADLHNQAEGLLASWSGPQGFGARNSSPGEVGAAVQEMLQGVIGLLQEGGDEKLGQPLNTRDPHTLESAASGNTRADLVANVEGARRVLLATGLLGLIRGRDLELASQIDAQSAAAVAMAKALPQPLNDALADPSSRQAMQQLITQLHSTAKLLERSAHLLS